MTLAKFYILLLSHILFATAVVGVHIRNIIPHFCKEGKNEITLDATGNSSVARIGINVPKGVEVIPNYLCYFTVASPPGTGLILTIRHASLNERDEIKIKSGNNIDRVWQRGVADSSKDVQLDNVATVPQRDYPSSMFVSYRPAAGRSEFNAGLDMAVTVFREKIDTCDNDFDCQNGRCISPSLRCDGYNNCGNSTDEIGCSGVSWWIVALLIAIAIIVVVLAIFLWVRMSRA